MLFSLGLFLLVLGVVRGDEEMPPHIIFVMADDLGYADVGFHGSEVHTPNLDALRAGGVELKQHYGMQLCTPARAAFMTGRFPMRYGLQSFVITPGQKYGLPPSERTLAEALHEAGYTTRLVGKWHLGHGDTHHWPVNRGFDSHYGNVIGSLDYFTRKRSGVLDWQRDGHTEDPAGHTTDILANEAEKIILDHDTEEPLFLFYSHLAPHSPYQAVDDFISNYSHLGDPERASYLALIEQMDVAIGRLVAALEKRGMRENTLIVFSSDNGGVQQYDSLMAMARKKKLSTPARNTPFRGSKASLYEGGVRVVALANWPGKIPAGSSVESPLHIVDWFPTFVNLAGGKTETEGGNKLDGQDIMSVLTEGAPSPHEEELLINVELHRGAIRRGKWKLVKNAIMPSRVELFDLEADPSESTNLRKEHRDVADLLEVRLNQYAKEMKMSLYLKTYLPFIQRDAEATQLAASPMDPASADNEDAGQAGEATSLPSEQEVRDLQEQKVKENEGKKKKRGWFFNRWLRRGKDEL